MEAVMTEDRYVWVTTRRMMPGTLKDFERAWRPERHPDGMIRAFAYWSQDEREVVGVAFWDSKESCDRWRASEAEAHRREAMSAYVEQESETFYTGRELQVP
jgi:heme-degrading monooxygenase HmoA